MVLKITRLISLLFTTLITGVAFCHVLELPNKLTLPASTWLTVQQVLYKGFGAKIGFMEVGAIFSALLLLFLVRKHRISLMLTLIASICLFAALVVWLMIVNPVNLKVDIWTLATLPTDWELARNQWEYGHAIRAALFIIGLFALISSVLADTTARNKHNQKQNQAFIH